MPSANFRSLGRSGLVVSQFALGTMTFGASRWGADKQTSSAVFDSYVAGGGNFIDCADVYSGGQSEDMVGAFVAQTGLRDQLVLATKAGFSRTMGHPQAGGNGAKNIYAALEGSLRRLRTDYVDLFWLHVWDMQTPAAEVLQTMAGLIRAGKIRYFGLSNVPSWYAAQMATMANLLGLPAPIALQLQYSLVDRMAELDHIGAAQALGLGVMGWSPMAGGLLSGKYTREAVERQAPNGFALPTLANARISSQSDGRLNGANPFGDSKFSTQNWAVLDVVKQVAREIGCSAAQVALAWAIKQPGLTGVIIGASGPDQMRANLGAADVVLDSDQNARLAAISAPPGIFFSPWLKQVVFGGQEVRGWLG